MPPASASLPDVELVELARHGDREAFGTLLRRHDAVGELVRERELAAPAPPVERPADEADE